MKVNIASSILEIKEGDIFTENADALIIPANNGLWMGSGLVGVIKKRGGIEIEQQAVSKSPVEKGSTVTTTAGKLEYKFVVHSVIYEQDLRTDEESVRDAVRKTMTVCKDKELFNIIFCDFIENLKGISEYQCMKVMFNEIIDFLVNSDEKFTVQFLFLSKDNLETGKIELEKIFTAG